MSELTIWQLARTDTYDLCSEEVEGQAIKTACQEAADEIERLRNLNQRALAIITEALMHGMPITEEIAAVRNEIVGLHERAVEGEVSDE